MGKVPLDDATYQVPRLYKPRGFKKEDFFMFSFNKPIKFNEPLTYMKHVIPRAEPFWP